KLGAIERDSFAATLARIETPSFALNLRGIPKGGPIADWLNKTQTVAGYDAFIMVDRIRPAHYSVVFNRTLVRFRIIGTLSSQYYKNGVDPVTLPKTVSIAARRTTFLLKQRSVWTS